MLNINFKYKFYYFIAYAQCVQMLKVFFNSANKKLHMLLTFTV